MFETLMIFCLAATGSLVCLSADLAHRFILRKAPGAQVAANAGRGHAPAPLPQVDPVLTFGLILACYGAIALVLVSELPGALALERTGLAFALLCAGGLIGEIAITRDTRDPSSVDTDTEADAGAAPPPPMSLTLSLTLMLVLNLALAVLTSGQGLIGIVPPKAASANHATELDPIVVVSQRRSERRGTPEPF